MFDKSIKKVMKYVKDVFHLNIIHFILDIMVFTF